MFKPTAFFFLLLCLALARGQKITYLLNWESCEQGSMNSQFTRVGLADESCTLLPGLEHATIKCTGKKGMAVGSLWGILK